MPTFRASASKTSMKVWPIRRRFSSGSVTPASVVRNSVAGVHHPEVDAEVAAEGGLDLVPLVQPEQAVVHEDAGQAVADGPVHQRRSHRRVHPAGEAADHPRVGPASSRIRAVSVSMKCPAVQSGVAAADVEQEGADDLAAPRACAPPRDGTARA